MIEESPYDGKKRTEIRESDKRRRSMNGTNVGSKARRGEFVGGEILKSENSGETTNGGNKCGEFLRREQSY